MLINKEIAKEKKWVTKSNDTPEEIQAVKEISRILGVNEIVAKLLYNRGYKDPASANSFIRMEREILRNPFDMKDMDKAVKRIRLAIERKEIITVYGDYDVDGVTSVCTLYLYLKSQGANVRYYIPNRSGEGYGVSENAIQFIKDEGSTLIITVDTGITANDEVEFAKTIGVDFLITDHHECRAELPCAVAIVNPHRPDCSYPFKELAGVGVVFKLICAYDETYNEKDRFTSTLNLIKTYADLVAIGTIADVMPIKEENRIIVKYGLGMIESTSRIGLAALIEASGAKNDVKRQDKFERLDKNIIKKKKKNKVTSSFIGFTLAPTDDKDEAMRIAEELCAANKERQAEENKIMLEANTKIADLDIENNPVIVLDADDWHHGVIGIVSSRLTEKYSRPSILISFEGNDGQTSNMEDVGKGSGRSIKGLNLVDALCYCKDELVKFGGHELAAGLSVTREALPRFIKKINDFARENLSGKELIPVIETDCEIRFDDISLPLAESLQLLEPYGVGNPIPMFIMNGVTVVELNGVSEGKHTRFTLGNGESTVGAMYFSNSPSSLGIYVGDKVDVLFSIDINEWQDRKNVQLIIRDIKPSGFQKSIDDKEKQRFEQIRAGATFYASEDILPTREDFVAVYKFLQSSIHAGKKELTHKDIMSKLAGSYNPRQIGYIKLKYIFMVFKELNIVGIEEIGTDTYRFWLHYSSAKRNLDKSNILRKLRSQIR